MHNEKRRTLIKCSGILLGTGLLTSIGTNASASEHKVQMNKRKHSRSVAINADNDGVCATCRYWGGMRRVSEDKNTVYSESLGWCNNPESHHYQSMTTPITGPMKSWEKWEAL